MTDDELELQKLIEGMDIPIFRKTKYNWWKRPVNIWKWGKIF